METTYKKKQDSKKPKLKYEPFLISDLKSRDAIYESYPNERKWFRWSTWESKNVPLTNPMVRLVDFTKETEPGFFVVAANLGEEKMLLTTKISRFPTHEIFDLLIKASPSNPKLDEIQKEIKESAYMLDLKEGWDQEHASVISESLYKTSVSFLINYVAYLSRNYNTIIACPEINPCPDGSIDLSWRHNDYRLLINVKLNEGEFLAFFYGDKKNEKTLIKGVVKAHDVDESLAIWMKNLKA